MNVVVSDPKTRKAYSKKVDSAAVFSGKKVGQEMDLGIIGLEGYSGKITGGSDKEGFPMKWDLEGGSRRLVFISKDVKKGSREKVSRRGNLISAETAQLNIKIVKEGKKKLEELLGGVKKEPADGNASVKEQMVKESLENVGKISADEAKNIKGKVKG